MRVASCMVKSYVAYFFHWERSATRGGGGGVLYKACLVGLVSSRFNIVGDITVQWWYTTNWAFFFFALVSIMGFDI